MNKIRQGMSAKGFIKNINENADTLGTENKLNLSVRTPAQIKKVLNEQSEITVVGNKTQGGYSEYTTTDGGKVIIKGLAKQYNEAVEVYEPTEVSTLEALQTAIANKAKYIKLTDNIEASDMLVFNDTIHLDGNNKSITFSNPGKNVVFTNDALIENLIVINTLNSEDWVSNYGLQVYNGIFTIRNCSFSGCNAGLLVNSSNAKLDGTIDVSNNTFGGIEVSKSSELEQPSVLDLNNATLVNTSEAYGKPTIWTDSEFATVENAEALTENDSVKEGQIQFYLKPENSVEV